MDSNEQENLLIEINTKLETLVKQFDKVSNGVGFPRCAERKEQLITVFRRIDKLEDTNKWLWRALAGAGISWVGSLIVGIILISIK